MAVDVGDPVSLSSFCAGCRLIINCAGPSFEILDQVARAALIAKADYVDPGGEDVVCERLAKHDWVTAGRIAILSAGMMPGLSGLLPKWLAQQRFGRRRALTAYVCLKDHFTPAAAREYVLSLRNGYGESLAAWRNGHRV
jgi:saccharopine dehydrogenase-like NADP-dependent oxidoreductase